MIQTYVGNTKTQRHEGTEARENKTSRTSVPLCLRVFVFPDVCHRIYEQLHLGARTSHRSAYSSLNASVGSIRRPRRAGPNAAARPTAIMKSATSGRTTVALPCMR